MREAQAGEYPCSHGRELQRTAHAASADLLKGCKAQRDAGEHEAQRQNGGEPDGACEEQPAAMQVFGDAAPCIGAHSPFFLKCGRCCTAGVPPGGRQRSVAPGYAMLCVHEWTESPYNTSALDPAVQREMAASRSPPRW